LTDDDESLPASIGPKTFFSNVPEELYGYMRQVMSHAEYVSFKIRGDDIKKDQRIAVLHFWHATCRVVHTLEQVQRRHKAYKYF